MNPVLETIFKHRSIRKYKDQPLEDEKLNYIIKAAQAAPSWCNGQQVSIISIKDKSLREQFKKLCWNTNYIIECSVFLIFCSDFYRVSLAFEKEGKSEVFEKYISQLDPLLVGSHDVGIAMQNAALAAESLGLGTVYNGVMRTKLPEVIKLLNLPKYVIPLLSLCIGYPDDNPELKPRFPMSSVFFEDKYNTEKAKAGVDEYDVTFKKYVANRSDHPLDCNWSQRITEFYTICKDVPDGYYNVFKEKGYINIEQK